MDVDLIAKEKALKFVLVSSNILVEQILVNMFIHLLLLEIGLWLLWLLMVLQVEHLDQEVAELRQALTDKTEQEAAMLKV